MQINQSINIYPEMLGETVLQLFIAICQ